MTGLLAFLLAGLAYGVILWSERQGPLSPDGQAYMRMAKGLPVPRPYCLRWHVPRLGTNQQSWQAFTGLALVLAGGLMAVWVEGPWEAKLFATALFVGLPGIFRLNVFFPVLVDAPAFMYALASAVCLQAGYWWAAVPLVLIAGACKESAPIFAAAWTLNPLPLIGLLAVPWWRKGSAATEEYLTKPWKAAWNRHHGIWGAWQVTVLPWGLALPLALLAAPEAGWRPLGAFVVSLGLGYGQLLRSQDRARLYQWAAPAVIALAVQGVPVEWMALAAVAHVVIAGAYKGV